MTVHTGGVPFDPGLPTVLLVHGAGQDHTIWRFQDRWLAHRGFGVLAPDLPGHGRTDGHPLASIGEMAGWLAELLDEHAVSRAAVMGHSMGSLIAVELAATTDLVDRLVLVGTAGRMAVHPALLDAAEKNDPLATELITAWTFGAAHYGGHPQPGTWQAGATRVLLDSMDNDVLAVDLRACADYATLERATRVDVPTVAVSGAVDRMTPTRGAVAVATAIPGAESVIIDDAGHSVMEEAPHRFNRVLAGFLGAP